VIIVIDLGSCKFRAAAFDPEGRCLEKLSILSDNWHPYSAEQIKSACQRIVKLVSELECLTGCKAACVFVVLSYEGLVIEQLNVTSEIQSRSPSHEELEKLLSQVESYYHSGESAVLHSSVLDYNVKVHPPTKSTLGVYQNKLVAHCAVTCDLKYTQDAWSKLFATCAPDIKDKCVLIPATRALEYYAPHTEPLVCIIDIGNTITMYLFKHGVCVDLINTSMSASILLDNLSLSETQKAQLKASYGQQGNGDVVLDVGSKQYVLTRRQIALAVYESTKQSFLPRILTSLRECKHLDKITRFVMIGSGANVLSPQPTHDLLTFALQRELDSTLIPSHKDSDAEWALVFAAVAAYAPQVRKSWTDRLWQGFKNLWSKQ
jgi:hypothetical protein